MADKRKVYSREFKEQAVELLNTSGKPGAQIEAELGIGNGVIYRWRRQLQEEGPRAFPGNGNDRDKEVAELRRENAELREEREILRKAIAIFSDRRRK
jgi:transposase